MISENRTDIPTDAPRIDAPRAEYRQESSIADLLKRLRDDTTTLLRQEVMLAKVEASEKLGRAGRNAAKLAAGGLIAYAGFILILLAVTALLGVGLAAAGLSERTAGWLAPLIVGVVVVAIGYAMTKKAGENLKNESVVPEKTVESIREDKEWLQQKIR